MIQNLLVSLGKTTATRQLLEQHVPLTAHRTQAFDDVIQSSSLFHRVEAEALKVHEHAISSTTTTTPSPSTWWYDLSKPPQCAIEETVAALFQQFVRHDSSSSSSSSSNGNGNGNEVTGAEWWVQHRRANTPQHFHFDTDMGRHSLGSSSTSTNNDSSEKSIFRCPSLSSVLYLTESGGPTVVLGQRPTMSKWSGNLALLPEEATECDIMFPRRNRYMLFRGDLLHGVLPCNELEMRTTLLVNWWCGKKPKDPACSVPTIELMESLTKAKKTKKTKKTTTTKTKTRIKTSPNAPKTIALETTDLQTGGKMLGTDSLACSKLTFDIDLSLKEDNGKIGGYVTTSAYFPIKLLDREDVKAIEEEKEAVQNYSDVVHRIVGMGRLRLVENQFP